MTIYICDECGTCFVSIIPISANIYRICSECKLKDYDESTSKLWTIEEGE